MIMKVYIAYVLSVGIVALLLRYVQFEKVPKLKLCCYRIVTIIAPFV